MDQGQLAEVSNAQCATLLDLGDGVYFACALPIVLCCCLTVSQLLSHFAAALRGEMLPLLLSKASVTLSNQWQ